MLILQDGGELCERDFRNRLISKVNSHKLPHF